MQHSISQDLISLRGSEYEAAVFFALLFYDKVVLVYAHLVHLVLM